MRFLKLGLALLAIVAAYQGYRHFVLGVPFNPEKTLGGWSQQLAATTPKKLTDSIVLENVRFEWFDGLLMSKNRKVWKESYLVFGPQEMSTLESAKNVIVDRMCHDERYQMVMSLMQIELYLYISAKTSRFDDNGEQLPPPR